MSIKGLFLTADQNSRQIEEGIIISTLKPPLFFKHCVLAP